MSSKRSKKKTLFDLLGPYGPQNTHKLEIYILAKVQSWLSIV